MITATKSLPAVPDWETRIESAVFAAMAEDGGEGIPPKDVCGATIRSLRRYRAVWRQIMSGVPTT